MDIRIPFDELYGALRAAMLKLGFPEERAELCARLFAETTRDGVYTHGLNRLPRFLASIRNGMLNVTARAEKTGGVGAFERWQGNRAAGNLSAHECMSRAVELSKTHGLGCVALRDTNHWLRAGTYGWLAADAGVIGMNWTNTMPNLVPWGGIERGAGKQPHRDRGAAQEWRACGAGHGCLAVFFWLDRGVYCARRAVADRRRV